MKTLREYLGTKKFLVAALYVVILAIGVGFLLLRGGAPGRDQPAVHARATADTVEKHTAGEAAPSEATLYICPMNCVPPMEKPGFCPVCGMELVAVSAEEHRHEEGPPRIALSEDKARTAGIRLAPVEEKFVDADIRLFGKIEYDPVEQYRVTAFAPGIIDRIYVKRAGQTVRRGDPLFDMHSSELFVLEQDLFEILKEFPDVVDYRPARGQIYKRQMRPPRRTFNIPRPGEAPKEEIEAKQAAMEKLDQIRRKMRLLGLTQEDIERVIARGLPSGISTVTTPTTGIVLEQFAYKGSYVNTGETIFTIANPTYIWARLDGYASDFPWVRLGQEAEFQVDAYPGETFKGKVQYLDPEFDPKTRTFKVGVLYTDPRRRLNPNMLVRGVIHSRMTATGVAAAGGGAGQKPPLVISDTAPLITGSRAVVYVEVPGKPGTYEGREVVLGPRAKGYYVVKHGLKKGELVVVNGNFKIDSAVQIMARPSMMEPQGGKPPMGHDHGGPEPMQMQPGAMGPGAGESPAHLKHHTGSEPMPMEMEAAEPSAGDKEAVVPDPMQMEPESGGPEVGHQHKGHSKEME